jgi:chromate transporter
VPGPLFSFAGYLGWSLGPWPSALPGAALALVAIVLPSFLLLFGLLPLWPRIGGLPRASAALAGVNAVVVGLLVGALYNPVWTGSVSDWRDVAIVAVDFVALTAARAPAWLVVALSALLGAAFLNA